MPNEDLVQQILQMISQLSPDEVVGLIKQLEAAGGEEPAEPVGNVSPEGGMSGVPLQ